jgi:hypothetical protein
MSGPKPMSDDKEPYPTDEDLDKMERDIFGRVVDKDPYPTEEELDNDAKRIFPRVDKDPYPTDEEIEATNNELFGRVVKDTHPTKEELDATDKDIFGDKVAPLKDRARQNEEARKAKEAQRAINMQQVLLELMQSDSMGDIRKTMNKYFAFAIDDGEAKMIKEINNDVQIWKMSAFKEWCRTKSVPIETMDPDGTKVRKEVPLLPIYNAGRFEYNGGLGFDPSKTFNRYDRSVDTYNTWRDWETKPVKPKGKDIKKLRRLLQFIFVVICDRNVAHFKWVCTYVAQMLQDPSKLKGTALVLIGEMGIGKSFFTNIISRLVGYKYSYSTSNSEDIFGNFNGHLEELVVLVLEEAFWAGSHKHESMLKTMITEPKRPVNPKYRQSKMVQNYLRLFILANPGWVVPATLRDRRFCVLHPSEAHLKDYAYYAQLTNILDDGGLEALMYFFMNYNINKVNLRETLKTDALVEQQLDGLEPVGKWLIEEFLWTGTIKSGRIDGDAMTIGRSDIYDQFTDWCRNMGIRKRITSKQFGILLGSYFPLYDAQGEIQKAKNGRIISIFTGNDTTDGNSHVYVWPSLFKCKSIIGKKLNLRDDYWDGSYGKWQDHPNSSTFPVHPEAPPVDKDKVNRVIKDGTIIIRGSKDQNRHFDS